MKKKATFPIGPRSCSAEWQDSGSPVAGLSRKSPGLYRFFQGDFSTKSRRKSPKKRFPHPFGKLFSVFIKNSYTIFSSNPSTHLYTKIMIYTHQRIKTESHAFHPSPTRPMQFVLRQQKVRFPRSREQNYKNNASFPFPNNGFYVTLSPKNPQVESLGRIINRKPI
ncbi:MAG: hypothetical protein IJ467_06235 [Bacteroidaceae bacterium]|nr:hypothetical protein [Bacteroidaceae bacterium]